MRTLITCILIATSFLSLAQPGFIKILGHPYPPCRLADLLIDNDTIVTYASGASSSHGIWFAKFDKNGKHIMSNIISKENHLFLVLVDHYQILQTNDGGYAIYGVGYRTDTSANYYNYFMKVDHDFNLENLSFFDEVYSKFPLSYSVSLVETKNGFFIFTATQSYYQAVLIKIDKSGNVQWKKKLSEPNVSQIINKIKKIDDNTFIACGGSTKFIIKGNSDLDIEWGEESFYFFALDSLGNIKWSHQWVSNNEYEYLALTDFQKLPDGGWIFCGAAGKYYEGIGEKGGQSCILRVDKDFNILWEKELYAIGFSSFFSLEKTIDNNFIAVGHSFEVEAIHHKFNIDGETIWSRTNRIGEAYYFNHYGLGVLSDGSIISCGSDFTGEGEHRNLYGYLMKLTNDGCIDISECPDWTAVEAISKEQIDIDIFPNPTSYFVTFQKFNEVLQKPIDIEIFDVMGRKIKNTTIPIFEQNIDLDISNLTNGVYFCRFYQDETLLFVKKLIKQ